ncbi:Uu.00g047840.m01.CDS01 [Anthostomella pinea]|uniref:Uu.00g047840.m01.CDS01 n=1 Tax=Anthostomella pinea TaxID=933095 RepID=A0AAI8YEJ5_9PEZI|nr:Uu.00g047840.m01.CDS01 [Anthostomella pinea]
MEESGMASPLPATLEPISRPSSTSTTASAAIAQLPGINALAASVTSSPQPRATSTPIHNTSMAMNFGESPAAHAPMASGNLPTCQNCSTSTTPLWRRDEVGSVLCNACGLFLKLHGRPRPISLKTDVIKSRNRVKTMRPDMQMKKKVSNRPKFNPKPSWRDTDSSLSSIQQSLPPATNGNNFQHHDSATAAATAAALAAVRASQQQQQRSVNGHGHGTDSPVSRTATPNIYDPQLAAFQAMDQYQPDNMAQYPPPGISPGRAPSPLNGDHPPMEAPQTNEQLLAANSSLKTRVSELDLINELYRGRLQQLEQDIQTADNYRHSAEMSAKEAATERAQREEIQRQLEDSHRRENILKRRLDEMEQEIHELKGKVEESELEHAAKKPRLEEPKAEETELSTPQSAS